MLFVPGDRPERFEKAAGSGADLIAVDLEDAVAPDRKDLARATVLDYLGRPAGGPARRFVRINSPRTLAGLKDLAALAECAAPPDGLLVPMVASADEVRWIDTLLAHRPVELVAVIESAEGLERAYEIAGASPRLAAIGFGSADFSAETGGTMDWEPLLHARSRIAAACAQHRRVALDGVWLDFNDEAGLVEETRRIRALGFRGKIAIHPKQVAGIHKGFAPSEDEVAKAHKIVAAFDAAGGSVTTVDGRMIDLPLYESARETIAAAAA